MFSLEPPEFVDDWTSSLAHESNGPSRTWLWAVRFLAAVAIAISGYLFLASHAGGAAGCSGDGGCGAVLASRWSRWFSFPIAVPAGACYFAALLATFAVEARPRVAWMVLIVLAVVIAGAALWFIALQTWVLHRICPFCMAVHGCGVALSALILGQVLAARTRADESDPARFSAGSLGTLAALGGAAVALLMAGQWFSRPAASVITFEKTTIRVERTAFPSLGKQGARRFAAVFVDYTCDHCRELHHLLARVLAGHPGEFEVLVLPLPLDARCNRNLRQTHPPHEHACELANLALAVWRADASRFPEMDAWLFGSETPRPLADARARAVELVGEAALRKAEADPVVAATIRQSIEIFTRAGGRQIPVLMFGRVTLTGPIAEQPNASKLIETHLGLAAP